MAPEAAGIAAFGKGDSVGLESREDVGIFGEKVIFAVEASATLPGLL
jgi:hypothetical protein